ncbi:hypothetical protein C8R42DRAFT_656759 [Lentinula raphanica]|nr:hypothetical protein C8R42DRAFT_656759 [Lentinula raphanica]
MLVFEGVWTNSFSWNDIKIPLKVIYHGRIPFITHTVGQDFGFIGFSWQLTAQDILFVRYLVQRIGGRKIKWSRAHVKDERELQIRRAQSKEQCGQWVQTSTGPTAGYSQYDQGVGGYQSRVE